MSAWLQTRDPHAGFRHVGEILCNQGDASIIRHMPSAHLFTLFRDGIVGAARQKKNNKSIYIFCTLKDVA